KLAVAETASSLAGGLPAVTQANSGFVFTPESTDFVDTITIANGGAITTTTANTGAPENMDPVMLWTPSQTDDAPDAPINWACTTTPATALKYVPAECREDGTDD